MNRKHQRKRQSGVWARPARLPFMEAICNKLNIRVSRDNERVLLATYERYFVLNGQLASIEGDEKRFLFSLARKHHSFIANNL